MGRTRAAALDGAFYQTGQRCTASSRLIVQSKVHDAFVERMVDALEARFAATHDHAVVVDVERLRTDLVELRRHVSLPLLFNSPLAWQIAQRTYVLENGSLRFSGTPAALLASDELRQAYLGL